LAFFEKMVSSFWTPHSVSKPRVSLRYVRAACEKPTAMRVRDMSSKTRLGVIAAMTVLLVQTPGAGARNDGEGWVQEPVSSSSKVEDSGHAYLDSASVHRGDDGLIYFNESTGGLPPGELGDAGVMKDAYDCKNNIKYLCVDLGDFRDDPKSRINATDDPALLVYRHYLCGDAEPESSRSASLKEQQPQGRSGTR